jgi:nickel/cobalt transporter (NiCoT) family protein
VSVLVALVIGSIEVLGLLADKFSLSGPVWDFVAALNDNFGSMGYLIIAIFAVSWIASVAIYRIRGYETAPVRHE